MECPLIVYHTDLSPEVISRVQNRISQVTFIEVLYKAESKPDMASQKMYMWNLIIHDTQHFDDDIMIMDCDMLCIKDVASVFDNEHFDFCYTRKSIGARFPINTGVIFVRNKTAVRDFFQMWYDKTNTILKDNCQMETAIREFGSADQLALNECTCDRKKVVFYETKFIHDCNIQAIPASLFNMHKDWSDPHIAKLIHFKSGWGNILIYPGSYEEAVWANGWAKWESEGVWQWESSYTLWKIYERRYENTISM
jgi:hypothetical protein